MKKKKITLHSLAALGLLHCSFLSTPTFAEESDDYTNLQVATGFGIITTAIFLIANPGVITTSTATTSNVFVSSTGGARGNNYDEIL